MGKKIRQPTLEEGWEGYKQLVKEEIKANTHMMKSEPHVKCMTHKDCHLDSFYPGKLYRAMKMERDEEGYLRMKK